MRFERVLSPARLVRRYKRFLADVILPDGKAMTVHCPNTGAMTGCQEPGSRIWLSRSDNPRRKYAYTWEIVETAEGVPVGINTGRSNALVAEALAADVIEPLAGYQTHRREVPVTHGRLDFLLSDHSGEADCYLEVKNVTAAKAEADVALFPDARSVRATRHVEALMALRESGQRAAILFCVQRSDVNWVRPDHKIDPAFGTAIREALAVGVEVYAYGARVGPGGIKLDARLAFDPAL